MEEAGPKSSDERGGGTHSIGQSPPTHCAHKLVGVVLLLVLVQDALDRVKLEGQQRLGQSLVVQVQRVVFTACTSAARIAQRHER